MNGNTYNKLLTLLSDESFISGHALGEAMSLSRAAIWKQIQILKSWGLGIQTAKGKGYRLAHPLQLFEKEKILKYLPDSIRQQLALNVLLHTDSTNHQVRHIPVQNNNNFSICVADYQYAGKGRRGRRWESPLGSNCYYSLLWKAEKGIAALEGLSLMAGLALKKTLEETGVESLQLKWPNDVLQNGKKLAGILIEIEGDLNGECQIIAGMGINLHIPATIKSRLDQPVTDIYSTTGIRPDKNLLAARLTTHMINSLRIFDQHGFKPFQKQWNDSNAHKNRCVALQVANGHTEGKCLGVDGKGSLIIHTANGIEYFSGGEISVRMVDNDIT